MAVNKTKAEFQRLLQLRNEHPEQVTAIDAQIRDTFTETHAIFVLDMAGFSRFTVRYGIIHFLAAFQRLCAIALPLIQHHQGALVKAEADNIFAVFPDPQGALEAAIDILKALAAINTGLPDALDLYASIGIGYGEVLMIAGDDLFGNEMNLACKLGEDLARHNEILLTEAAYTHINAHSDVDSYSWEKLEFSISGLELTTYKAIVPLLP